MDERDNNENLIYMLLGISVLIFLLYHLADSLLPPVDFIFAFLSIAIITLLLIFILAFGYLYLKGRSKEKREIIPRLVDKKDLLFGKLIPASLMTITMVLFVIFILFFVGDILTIIVYMFFAVTVFIFLFYELRKFLKRFRKEF